MEIQWYLVEFQSGVKVQRGSVNQASTSVNVGLSTLSNVNNAFVLMSKSVHHGDVNFDENDPVEVYLNSVNSLGFYTYDSASSHVISWQVVEFTDDSLDVQRNYTQITSNGTTTKTSDVGHSIDVSRAMLLTSWASSKGGNDIDERLIRARIKDGNTAEFKREHTGNDDVYIAFEMIEFSDGTMVQTGALTFNSGQTSRLVTIDDVDVSHSIALSTVQGYGGQNFGTTQRGNNDVVGEGAYTMAFESPTSLRIERKANSNQSTVQWQVIEFNGSGSSPVPTATACQQAFPDGISVSSSSASTKIKNSAQLLGNPDSVLAVDSIDDNHSGSCGVSTCTASGNLPSVNLVLPAFQYSSTSSTLTLNSDTVLGNTGSNEYGTLNVNGGVTLTFSDNFSTYKTKKLETKGGNVTLNFVPGDYFFEDFKTNNTNLTLNVVGSGTVRIWSRKDIKFKEDALVNSPAYGVSGTASKLFLHTVKHFHAEKNSTVSAIIVGEEDFKVQDTARVFGAGKSSSKVELKGSGQLTFQSDQVADVDFNGACDNTPAAGALDYFLLDHDQSGISCLAEPVTLTAKDNSDATLDNFIGAIVLDTQSGKGSWSLVSGGGVFTDVTANDGLATYTFVESDDGVASFNLTYIEGASPINIDAYLGADSSLRDNDTEGDLAFAPSGFTFTQNALSNPPPAVINDAVLTQIAGASFNLHLSAYGQSPTDSECGVIESYTGSKELKFWHDYEDPLSGTLTPSVNGSAISATELGSSAQIITFTNGRAQVAAKYKDVGRIQIHAKDGLINGASNEFVVKPASLVITAITTLAGAANPGATSVAGSRFVRAGEAFSVTLEVRDAENDLTPNYGHEVTPEALKLTATTLVLPSAGRNGSDNLGTMTSGSSFSQSGPAGRFVNTATSWDEWGIIKLSAAVADTNYLGTGNVTSAQTSNVGRFYGADFSLISSNLTASCNGFTYMSQPDLTTAYNVHARGTGGNRLYNYDLGLLGSAGVSVPSWQAENNNAGVDLSSRISISASSWVNGEYSATVSNASFNRAASPDGPFDSLLIGLRMIGPDPVLMAGANMNATTNTDCLGAGNCNASSLDDATSIRYGRLEVLPSFGGETSVLDVHLKASYFDASGSFVTNSLDSCSAYIRTEASLADYTGGLSGLSVIAPTITRQLINGKTLVQETLYISAPGAGNTGSVELTYDAPVWLEYDWQGLGDSDPVGTASFGHYRGHDRVTYWREIHE